MGLFDGKVVIVTGAGGGLGRTHALGFAREGAAVVVNDLGGARDGAGQGTRMADEVVKEIEALGGKAAPNYDSVASFEGAKALVETALQRFGRLDVLVNNAGILRDKSMLKMDEAMFDLVVAVHLKGTWNCTRHAAEAMVAAGRGGRIINTTSIAGLKGNFGQSNYGPAKAGIWSLTITSAIELKKHGITVNSIAPMAKTRMTEDIDVVPAEMKPEHVTPVVIWLASEGAAGVTGRCFGVHPPRIFEYRMEMTEGVEKAGAEPWTVAEIAAALPRIETLGPAPGAQGAPAASTETPKVRDLPAIVDLLMKGMPRLFVKERAGTGRHVFHFHIAGARSYTVKVAEGACEILDGHQGTPTCNVRVDAESHVAMAEGKLNPQKAFMEGKLKADNLGEAMKYAGMFRTPTKDEQAQVQAAIAAVPLVAGGGVGGGAAAAGTGAGPGSGTGSGAGSGGSPQEIVDQIFARMGEAFAPAKAGPWKAAILWSVKGAGDYHVTVSEGACASGKGAPAGKPTCTVKLAAETLIGMVRGTVNPQKAFMEGKITADNLADMMKFGAAFDLKKGAAEAAKAEAAQKAASTGATAAAPRPPAPPKGPEVSQTRRFTPLAPADGLNREYLGRSFSGGAHHVRPEHAKAYAQATNDPNPHYLGTKEPVVAPPIFAVRLFHEAMLAPLMDKGLNADLLRLVHGEQDMRFHRLLRPWDLVTTRAIIHAIEDKSSGQVLKVLMKAFVEGEAAVEATASLFIRGEKRGEKKKEEAAPPSDPGAPAFTRTMTVDADQPSRYASASLDTNPIHLDDEVARMAGHKGVILHGLCTMAFSSQAFVAEACGGDPRRLRRLGVRFSKPVFPGDAITTRAWRSGEAGGLTVYAFDAVNQAGVTVISNGVAEVGA